MTALIFALGAIGAYGILYNLLNVIPAPARGTSVARSDSSNSDGDQDEATKQSPRPHSAFRFLPPNFRALLAPLFLLLMGNFGALLEILHQGGLFWIKNAATSEYSSRLWTWLDLRELSEPPALPFHFLPLDRYLWWWRSSRIIQDYNMVGNWTGDVIDEFPFFSFLLGDLHPHVLALPFGLLAIAVAMNLFFGGFRGTINLLGAKLHINLQGFLFSAIVIGGLAFLNTWDILTAASLIVAAYVLWRANENGWNWERLEEALLFILPLGILSVLLYFPFYPGFSSQAGGILPNFMYPTRGIHLWVMWGTLLIPILAYLVYLSGVRELAPASVPAHSDSKLSDSRIIPNWKLGFSLGLGFVLFLWIFSWIIGWIGSLIEKDFVVNFLASQSMTAAQFFGATFLRRLSYIGSLITLLTVLIPALAFLFHKPATIDDRPQTEDNLPPSAFRTPPSEFIFLLITLGAILILVPEFVYLRDDFGYRINTVFKFYYQAWMLLSLAAAFAVAYLLQNLRGTMTIIFRIVIGLVIFSGLLFPIFGVLTKTNNFKPYGGFTLDDFDRIIRENPDEAAAIEFLRSVPDGIITEAIGGGYSAYARISMFTGLQTVLGWTGHEAQWRGSYEPQGSRMDDITKLYTTNRWDEAQSIIEKYNIRYIYIGGLERASMPVNEEKFKSHLKSIFKEGSVEIYEVP
jgi:YYY domain-containing protein